MHKIDDILKYVNMDFLTDFTDCAEGLYLDSFSIVDCSNGACFWRSYCLTNA